MTTAFAELCGQYLVSSKVDYIFFDDIYTDVCEELRPVSDQSLHEQVMALFQYLLDHGLQPFNARGPDLPVQYWNYENTSQVMRRIENEWPHYLANRNIMGICWFGYPDGATKD